MSKFIENAKTAIRSLYAHKLRTSLTTTGIVIGVEVVIIIASIMNGASAMIEKLFDSFGKNMLIILPNINSTTTISNITKLTLKDVETLSEGSFFIETVSPQVGGNAQAIYGNKNMNTMILGATANIADIRNLELESGIFFSDYDAYSGKKICVIGKTVCKELFGYINPLGETMRISNIPFIVTGVVKTRGTNLLGQDQDDIVYVPIRIAQRRLFRVGSHINSVNQISVQAKTRDLLKSAEEEVKTILRQNHKIKPGDEDDFIILNLSQTMENSIKTMNIMKLLLIFAASISIITGGIGIMNIMLVSVNERKYEIGLRMAVGAHPSDITMQFLIEALVLSFIGGINGTAYGIFTSFFIMKYLEWPLIMSTQSIILAISSAACTGIFFGFYPALKASQMSPIEAMNK